MIEFITWVFSLILPPQDLISPLPTESAVQSAPTNSPSSVSQTTPSPAVLAQITQLPTVSPTSTSTPLPSPTTTSTIKPIQTSSATPQPTVKPTATPTSSPKPTTTSSPTPKPTKTATPTPSGTPRPQVRQPTGPEMDAMFTKYSEQYKVDRELLRRIAICESKLNVNALNKKYGYGGLYQFSPGSWKSYRKLMGLDQNPDLRFEPDEAIKTAAWMLSTGRQSAWPNCK